MISKLSILGFAAISTIFTVGCSRQNEPVAAQAYTVAADSAAPADSASYERVTDHRNFSEARRPVIVRDVVRDQDVVYRDRQRVVESGSRTGSRTVVTQRTKKNSAAIVLGSAGVGAAIGALAGGGKGAGIGALVGGGGGFVYDRATHEKRRVE